jgi:hypothetical protein
MMSAIAKESTASDLKRFSLSFKLNHSIAAVSRNINEKTTDPT